MTDDNVEHSSGQAEPQRKGGATAGIVLVVIGVLLLLAQFLPGLVWWSAWPLIIVALGVIQAVTPGRTGWSVYKLLDGLVTVAIGLALLAWTTGRLDAGFLGTLLSMWPVLIISLGFELLSKALHAPWLKAIGSVAIIAAIAFAALTAASGVDYRLGAVRGTEQDEIHISEPLGGATEASLNLNAGLAGISISEGTDLISIEGRSPLGEPRFDVERDGDTADLLFRLSDDGVIAPGIVDAKLAARLSDEVIWDIVLETGMSEVNADLSDLKVRSLELKPGVASCTVRLGEVDDDVDQARLDIRAGISSVSVRIPEGVEARVESRSGLTGHSVRGDFESTGKGTWETPGYDEADSGTWLIDVRSGIGSVDIDTY